MSEIIKIKEQDYVVRLEESSYSSIFNLTGETAKYLSNIFDGTTSNHEGITQILRDNRIDVLVGLSILGLNKNKNSVFAVICDGCPGEKNE